MLDWPAHSRTLTLLTYAVGLAFFFWLGAGDEAAWGATVLGVLLPTLFIAHFLTRRFGGKALLLRKAMLVLCAGGLLVGCLAPLVTAVLLALKVALIAAPYSPALLLTLLDRTPIWALAGLLVGAGLALAVYARHKPSTT